MSETDPKPADAGLLPSADVRAIEKEMSAEYDWRDNGSQHYMDDFANRAASLVCSRMQGEIDRLLAVLALMERNEERRDAEIDRLREEMAELRERKDLFKRGLFAVDCLIGDSNGVYGFHLNGNPAPWEDLQSGGRHEECLRDFDTAIDAARQEAADNG